MVAILCKGIVVAAVPELAEVLDDIVHFIIIVVCDTDRDHFFQHEASRVSLVNDDYAGAFLIMTTVRKFVTKDLDRRVIESEA